MLVPGRVYDELVDSRRELRPESHSAASGTHLVDVAVTLGDVRVNALAVPKDRREKP